MAFHAQSKDAQPALQGPHPSPAVAMPIIKHNDLRPQFAVRQFVQSQQSQRPTSEDLFKGEAQPTPQPGLRSATCR